MCKENEKYPVDGIRCGRMSKSGPWRRQKHADGPSLTRSQLCKNRRKTFPVPSQEGIESMIGLDH
jgi:hypothetical protein